MRIPQSVEKESHLPRRALVTGASGLLGRVFCRFLSAMGVEVVGAARSNPENGLTLSRYERFDLRDRGSVSDLVEEVGHVDLLIHCAAATNIGWCEANLDEAWDVNARGVKLVWEGFSMVPRKVFISSDGIFDGLDGPYDESDPPRPQNWYAHTKVFGELSALGADSTSLIVRGSFFGPTPNGIGLWEWMLKEARVGESVTGFRDVIFSPLSVPHYVGTVLELCRIGASGPIHLGSREGMSKFDFLRHAVSDLGLDLQVEPGSVGEMKGVPRPHSSELSVLRVERILGHRMPTLRAEIEFMADKSQQGGEKETM